jgi:hypothetical protein
MIGDGLTDKQADCLARGIKGSRLAVAAIYDRIAGLTGRDLPDFKTVALGLHDPVAAFTEALKKAAAAEPSWHRDFLAELAVQGMVDLTSALAEGSTPDAPIRLLPQNGDGSRLELQAFDAAMTETIGVGDFLGALNLAARRLCLIKAGAKQGTGFLIGPHTVLTNWHVMADLIDPATGKARDGSDRQISMSFETLADNQGRKCLVPKDWLVGFSPLAPQPGDPVPAPISPDGTHLDYCAIRVLGAPGRERGWYDISQTGQLDRSTDAFFVFQHPAKAAQRAGFATDAKLDTDADFLRHRVWTASGSSGGLCLDHRLTPIGLHHAAINSKTETDDQGRPILDHNRAVRLDAIHKAKPGLGEPDPLYDRVWRLEDASLAVIGRATTQAKLRMMAAGLDPPILIVQGGRLSGKSFTKQLLRGSIPAGSCKIIFMSAADLPADVADLARFILSEVGKSNIEIDALLQRQAAETTAPAAVADLAKIVSTALLQIADAGSQQPFTIWLVIDQLDDIAMPGIGSRTLLDQLYNDADLRRVLRVVLIGLKGSLLSVSPVHISNEQLPDPGDVQEAEVEDCLAGLMVSYGMMPPIGETRRHTTLILGATRELQPQDRQSTKLAVLSELLTKVYMTAVEKWQQV